MTGNYERTYRRSSARTLRRVKRAVAAKMNDFYVILSGVVLGLFVFMGCNLSVAADRGFNGGIGGELILAIAVAFGVNYLWHKIKSHLKD